MKKLVTLLAVVILLPTCGVRSQTNERATAKLPDQATIGKALALLGKVTSIKLIYTSSTAIYHKDGTAKALDLLEKKLGELKDKPLTPSPLMDLAGDVYNAERNLGLDVAVSDPQDLQAIQKILGNPGVERPPMLNDAEKGRRYKYGQWEFRAVDGSVKSVLLYCSTPRKK